MVLDKVRKLLAEQLDLEAAQITEKTDVADDLGADSLDMVELMLAIEEEFGVVIEDEDAIKLKSVGDLVAYIEAKI